MRKSAFSTSTQSRFALVVVDAVIVGRAKISGGFGLNVFFENLSQNLSAIAISGYRKEFHVVKYAPKLGVK